LDCLNRRRQNALNLMSRYSPLFHAG
jgi:hypothetical protein